MLSQVELRADQLVSVRFVPPDSVELSFADGWRDTCSLSAFGIDWTGLKPATLAVAPAGTGLQVGATGGESFCLDSASLRCAVDPTYAAKLEAEMSSSQFPNDGELEAAMDELGPCEGWAGLPQEDL
jgi:hypothetical protein